jgi:hypothetical protein
MKDKILTVIRECLDSHKTEPALLVCIGALVAMSVWIGTEIFLRLGVVG